MKKLILLFLGLTLISCSKDDVCTDKIEVTISKGGRYNMSITFSGTGSFRNITPLVTGGEPFILNGLPIYEFEWTYTPIDLTQSPSKFFGDTYRNATAGKYCVKITDRVGFSESTCGGGSTSSGSLDDFELVTENVECSAS